MSLIKAVADRSVPRTDKSSPGHASLTRRAPPELYCTFGFSHFREIEFFGLKSGAIGNQWMVSMVERLSEYSRLTIDNLLNDRQVATSTATRLHPINWKQKNIPIELSDLNWLPGDITSSEDFELLQLTVSRSRGRIIGFFDGAQVFQIVLLDPLHNMQPSKSFGYKVDHCEKLGSDWDAYQKHIDIALRKANGCECGAVKHLQANGRQVPHNGTSWIFCCHDDDLNNDIRTYLESGTVKSIHDVFSAGVEAILADYAERTD